MTENEMQIIIGKHFGIKNICIPNVLMIGEYKKEMLPEIKKLEAWQKPSKMYEADIVYITKSNYLVEVEIKVDINDFRNDFKKKIYHSSPLVSSLYYAFPEELYKKYEDELLEEYNIPNKLSPDGISRIDGMTVEEYFKNHDLWE